MGLDPDSKQLRILGSSASLESEVDSIDYVNSQSFLKGFFGVSRDLVIVPGEIEQNTKLVSGNQITVLRN